MPSRVQANTSPYLVPNRASHLHHAARNERRYGTLTASQSQEYAKGIIAKTKIQARNSVHSSPEMLRVHCDAHGLK